MFQYHSFVVPDLHDCLYHIDPELYDRTIMQFRIYMIVRIIDPELHVLELKKRNSYRTGKILSTKKIFRRQNFIFYDLSSGSTCHLDPEVRMQIQNSDLAGSSCYRTSKDLKSKSNQTCCLNLFRDKCRLVGELLETKSYRNKRFQSHNMCNINY